MIEFRCALYALSTLMLGLLTALPAPLRAQDPLTYTVTDIAVDTTASDAVAARSQALVEGQRAGLDLLLRRLTPVAEHARLPSVGNLPIDRFVQNFSITREELSATRYIAQLTVTYDPMAVKELLQASRLSFTETVSAPILVLPLYQGRDGPRLWPEDNPWWQAWADTLDANALLRLTLPLGDLDDMARLSPEQVAAGDRSAMLSLAQRYGAANVLIATATPSGGGEVPAAVQLATERLGEVDRTGGTSSLQAAPGQSLEDLLRAAAERLQSSLHEGWKGANLLSFDQSGRMLVEVPVSTLSDWVAVERGLNGLPEVSGIDIIEFSDDAVRAQIRYIGDEIRLEDALFRQGLSLVREGETWQLLPTGLRPPERLSGTSASSSDAPR
jgi:hypothetical protein